MAIAVRFVTAALILVASAGLPGHALLAQAFVDEAQPSVDEQRPDGAAVLDDQGGADAEPLPAVRAMVVDFQDVVRQSEAATSVRDQIDEHRRAFQAEFVEIEDELRALEQQLTEEQATLGADEFNQRRRAFEQRITEAQRTAQVRRAALDQAMDESMSEIRSALVAIIQNLAEANRANLVLNQSEVILMGHSLDFSDQALQQLNDELPFVSVNLVAEP